MKIHANRPHSNTIVHFHYQPHRWMLHLRVLTLYSRVKHPFCLIWLSVNTNTPCTAFWCILSINEGLVQHVHLQVVVAPSQMWAFSAHPLALEVSVKTSECVCVRKRLWECVCNQELSLIPSGMRFQECLSKASRKVFKKSKPFSFFYVNSSKRYILINILDWPEFIYLNLLG